MQIPFDGNELSRDRNNWRPATFSVVSHVLFLAALFVMFVDKPNEPANEQWRVGRIVLAQVRNDKVEYFADSKLDAEQLDVLDVPPAIQSDTPPPLPKNLQNSDSSDSGIRLAESLNVEAMTNQDTNSAHFQYRLSKADLEMIEADQKHFESIPAKGPAVTINLFGSGDLTGRKFVFLIDRSKSMGEQGLRVLRQARSELVYAINRLQKNHFFQIIAYNDHITAMRQKSLLPADENNKQRVPNFMANLMAYGGTNHISAIYSALAFEPDVILILNDGGFPELNGGQIAEIGRLSSGTQIHSLHFGLGPAQTKNHFMQQLADACSGSYRYIDVRQWRRNELNQSDEN